ncbi:DMT family transporter [Aestuariispira insulae]|uniref:O-acetylserine/cysteine efflux transporter n=1 Tax=Aestuariispira insulae TaxID=1461337 RepID=A0A3D9HHX3_9PROT|nr:EamA family transporter [Aestuariispira insulae]RED49044.1 O-acetylserine/cysteine efflux transporter [Aestuariispira insulae]
MSVLSSQDQPVSPKEYAVLAAVLILWALNFLAIKFGVSEMPVWTALAVRFSLVSVILLPFIRFPKGQLVPLLVISAVLVPGHFGLLFWAVETTNSVGAVSVIVQMNPAFSILLAWPMFGDKPGVKRIAGLTIAFIGVVVLFYEPAFLDNFRPLILALGSAFCVGAYMVLVRRWQGISPLAIICWTSAFGTPLCWAIALINEPSPLVTLPEVSLKAWLGISYVAVVSSIIAHGSWAWLLRQQPISFLVPFTLLVPVIAMIATTLVLGEDLTWHMAGSCAIVLAGVGLITRSKAFRK